MSDSHLLHFIARLHVTIVHFPIALIIVAGLLTWIGRPGSPRRLAAAWCLGLGALGAALAATTGWMLADFEPIERSARTTLLLHRWLGVGVAALSLLALAASALTRGEKGRAETVHTGALFLAVVGVAIGGHLGGTLVHGSGYLTSVFGTEEDPARPAPPPAADADSEPAPGGGALATLPGTETGTPGTVPDRDSAAPAVATVDYWRDVEPILEACCYSCHGPRRMKGKLRLDRPEQMFQRAGRARVVIPGNPEASELYYRVTLPADDEDIMPADGDPLTPKQIQTIHTWISEGAHWQTPRGGPDSEASEPHAAPAENAGR